MCFLLITPFMSPHYLFPNIFHLTALPLVVLRSSHPSCCFPLVIPFASPLTYSVSSRSISLSSYLLLFYFFLRANLFFRMVEGFSFGVWEAKQRGEARRRGKKARQGGREASTTLYADLYFSISLVPLLLSQSTTYLHCSNLPNMTLWYSDKGTSHHLSGDQTYIINPFPPSPTFSSSSSSSPSPFFSDIYIYI